MKLETQRIYLDNVPKTIFHRFWNMIENSKRSSKYHFYINFLRQKKTVSQISEKCKTRSFQQLVNIIFPSAFWVKKWRISDLGKVQNKNFPVISIYHLSINFLAHKTLYFYLRKVQNKKFPEISKHGIVCLRKYHLIVFFEN